MKIEERLLRRYDELTKACDENEQVSEMPMTHSELREFVEGMSDPRTIEGHVYVFAGLPVRIVSEPKKIRV